MTYLNVPFFFKKLEIITAAFSKKECIHNSTISIPLFSFLYIYFNIFPNVQMFYIFAYFLDILFSLLSCPGRIVSARWGLRISEWLQES